MQHTLMGHAQLGTSSTPDAKAGADQNACSLLMAGRNSSRERVPPPSLSNERKSSSISSFETLRCSETRTACLNSIGLREPSLLLSHCSMRSLTGTFSSRIASPNFRSSVAFLPAAISVKASRNSAPFALHCSLISSSSPTVLVACAQAAAAAALPALRNS